MKKFDVEPLRGIRIGGADAWNKRVANAILIGMPFLGTIYFLFYSQRHAIANIALFQLVGWYILTGIGVGVGFHRLFSHKSFQTYPFLRLLFGIAGSFAFQGSVVRWVADHRRHHRFSDDQPDTHTPYRFPVQAGFKSQVRNLWHAHVGWMFDATTTEAEIFAPDLLHDPIARWLDRWYFLLIAVSLLLPYLIGYVLGGSQIAFQSFLLGGCVRVTLLHNFIWAINSIGHTWGGQPSSQRDQSRNNWLLALATFGEGWHNNHHASPRCAHNNWRGYEIDLNGRLIKWLEWFGVVWAVNTKQRTAADPFEKVLHHKQQAREIGAQES